MSKTPYSTGYSHAQKGWGQQNINSMNWQPRQEYQGGWHKGQK